MHVGTNVSEELPVSLIHPEHGGSMYFRNFGKTVSVQHEVSHESRSLRFYSERLDQRTGGAAPQIRQLDCSRVPITITKVCQQPDINTWNQPFIAVMDYSSSFESLGPVTLRFSPDTCTWTDRHWRGSTTNLRNTRSFSLNNTASHTARLQCALHSYIAYSFITWTHHTGNLIPGLTSFNS
jgi:hypothetical protein